MNIWLHQFGMLSGFSVCVWSFSPESILTVEANVNYRSYVRVE
jgi:hypothetical protein